MMWADGRKEKELRNTLQRSPENVFFSVLGETTDQALMDFQPPPSVRL